MQSPYKHLAAVYDRWQQSYGKDYSALILPRLLSTVRSCNIPVSSMVDVACGTGTLALLMAAKGWDVRGIDISAEMIARARAKCKGNVSPDRFQRQDMKDLHLPAPVALATSLYDSLNHLPTKHELFRTFRSVHAGLLPRGYFIFDVNNLLCFTTLWTQTQIIDQPGFTLVLKNSFSPMNRLARSEVTISTFEEGSPAQFRETVVERYFPKEDIERLLKKAGFSVIIVEDFNFTAVPEAGKIKTWWVGRKVD